MCLYYELINKSEVQICRMCGHTTRFPEIWLIGPSENRLESDMADSPDFLSSEFRRDRYTDSHSPIFGKSAKKCRPTRKNWAVGPWH